MHAYSGLHGYLIFVKIPRGPAGLYGSARLFGTLRVWGGNLILSLL